MFLPRYNRKGETRIGQTWMIQYQLDGVIVRKSAKTRDRASAERFLIRSMLQAQGKLTQADVVILSRQVKLRALLRAESEVQVIREILRSAWKRETHLQDFAGERDRLLERILNQASGELTERDTKALRLSLQKLSRRVQGEERAWHREQLAKIGEQELRQFLGMKLGTALSAPTQRERI